MHIFVPGGAIILFMQSSPQGQPDSQSPPAIQYERCKFCSRNFFKGKLKYHLKLCTQDAPMTISPKRTPRPILQRNTPQPTQNMQEQSCPYCQAKLPSFLMQKHVQRCQKPQEPPVTQKSSNLDQPPPLGNLKSSTETIFKEREVAKLPIIKRSIRERQVLSQHYQVKLREELSCFRRAQDIKQVQCPTCQRIFSREAALRHVPICQTLRTKERFSMALKRKGNRSVGEQYTQRSGNKRVLPQNDEEGKVNYPNHSALELNPQNSHHQQAQI